MLQSFDPYLQNRMVGEDHTASNLKSSREVDLDHSLLKPLNIRHPFDHGFAIDLSLLLCGGFE